MDRYKEKIEILLRKHAKYLVLSALGVGFALGFGVGFAMNKGCDCEVVEQSNIAEADSREGGGAVIEVRENEVEKRGGAIEEGVRDEQLMKVCADVSGAVKSRGVYCLSGGSLIVDYLNQAGGVNRKDAAVEYLEQALNMASEVRENAKIYIPYRSEVRCEVLSLSYQGKQESSTGQTNNLPSYTDPTTIIQPIVTPSPNSDGNDNDCIDINTASLAELDELNGVGESTANQIITARPFSSIEDLLNVSGIGDAKLSQFRDQVCPI